ncbi:MAG: hypothetical protein JWQ44_112 [Chthoniobacter sp.]|nr:hypothetical protein [Chthoniobacter sp.]
MIFDQAGRFDERWLAPRATRWLTWALALVLIASAVTGIFLRLNDFHLHHVEGAKVLAGRTPGDGASGGIPAMYLMGRTMFNAALALVPHRLARAMSWVAAVVALAVSLQIWGRVFAVDPLRLRALAVLAIWWVLPFLHRDMDDCGLQVFTLALFSAGAGALVDRRPAAAGVWMALAASYKTTPLLVLPFLLYKRLWREAGVMIAVLVLVNVVLPVPFLGWKRTVEAHQAWVAIAMKSNASDDPSSNGLDAPRQQNLALKIALVRLWQTFPPEHPLFLAKPGQKDWDQQLLAPVSEIERHWAFFQFFDFDPATVNLLLASVLVTLGLGFAWVFRRPGRFTSRFDLARELAVVAMLSAVLSPICWRQHLVLMLPLVMVVLWDGFRAPMKRWEQVILVGVWCCIWLPQRELLGRNLSVVIDSYKLPTIACLALMFLALRRGASPTGESTPSAREAPEPAMKTTHGE